MNDDPRSHDDAPEDLPQPPAGEPVPETEGPADAGADADAVSAADEPKKSPSPFDTAELDALLDMSDDEMDELLRNNYGEEAVPKPLPDEPVPAPEPEEAAVVPPEVAEVLEPDPVVEEPVAAAAAAAADPELPDHEQKTIEADTLALADREEAREAALAGLKARAAANPPTETAAILGPAVATGEYETGDVQYQGPPPSDAGLITVGGGDDGPPPRPNLWVRFLIAAVMVIVSTSAATAAAGIISIGEVLPDKLTGLDRDDLGEIEAGEPQIFLILGSDKRANYGENDNGLSDTAMLVRIDAENEITMFSIPRDLKVEIPGYGTDRFNAAYAYGGPKLTLQTVRDLTDQRIEPNHVVNIDFTGFADVVNAIDCAYVDIDRRYYSPGGEYAAIDLSAGYQRLCGLKALQYVRYRHNDNDLVRGARQQEFLREARQKMPDASTLLEDRQEWFDIIKNNMSTTIANASDFIETAKLVAGARNTPVKQIKFEVSDLGGSSGGYVVASDEQIEAVVSEFLGEEPVTSTSSGETATGAPSDAGTGEPASDSAEGAGADTTEADSGADIGDEGEETTEGETGGNANPNKNNKPKVPQAAPGTLVETATGADYAVRISQAITNSGRLLFPEPILYPTQVEARSSFAEDTRAYTIDGGGKKAWNGYKIVLRMPGTTYPTAYYGISGTNWVDAPLFRDATTTQKMDGRTYQIYNDGDGVRMVAFKQDGNMYWVTNTLDKLLSPGQMIGIARSLTKYEPFAPADPF